MALSWTTIFSVIFIAYIMNSVYTIYKLYSIPPCKEGKCVDSYLLKEKADFWFFLYSSPYENIHDYKHMREILVWDDFNCTTAQEKTVNVTIPNVLKKNGTAYIHIFMVPKRGKQPTLQSFIHRADITFATGTLTEYAVPEATAFNLLGSEEKQTKPTEKTTSHSRPVTHWRSRIVVEVVTDTMRLSAQEMPRELIRYISVTPKGDYLPTVRIDSLNYRIRDLVLVNETSDVMQLLIVYNPISFGKLRLWLQLEAAMTTMTSFGFTPKDIDEVKGIFTDINMYLLCMTFIVAAFHLLFDFLAFKNDISFWRKKQDMVGLSSRTLIWRCVSQLIVFFYLMDENTSLLVLVPSGIGTLIEMWKVSKAFRVTITWNGKLPKMKFGETSDEEKATQVHDAEIMKYLSYLLYPLCAVGAIYSLFYMPHKSWYSWCIQSLVNGVYAFGFLFMLPQLFVNYKLKSVAHLPWKAFMYKAFNTFIDDIFAFIITMPTAHRVACFRDDVVFLVYLYQRWLYPVDKRRVNEYGQSYSDDEQKTKVE